MITNAANPAYMVQTSAEFRVAKRWSDALKHVWLYKNPDRTPAGETTDDVYANYSTKKIKWWNKITQKFDLHEITPEILDIIDNGTIVKSQEIASVVDRTESFKPGYWSFDKDIILKSRNADGSQIVAEVKAVIDGVSTLLVEDTDYAIWVTAFWDTFIKLIEKTTTGLLEANAPSSVTINIKYSATPDATLKKIEHLASALPSWFVMVIEEKRSYNGNECGVRIFMEDCQNIKSITKPISDADNTTAWYPCEVTGTIKKHEYFGFDA